MSLVLIRAALETALAAMSPSLSTAYENVPFTPVTGAAYQRVYIMAVDPDNPEMGTFTQERGFMQVSLYYPLGTGSAAATARAQLIRSTFKRGMTFTASGLSTTIEKTPEIAPSQTDDDRFVLHVRIRFFANYAA